MTDDNEDIVTIPDDIWQVLLDMFGEDAVDWLVDIPDDSTIH
jgi:hypothetical protein